MNKKKTYKVQTKGGKVLETFRGIACASLYLKKKQKNHFEKLEVVKI